MNVKQIISALEAAGCDVQVTPIRNWPGAKEYDIAAPDGMRFAHDTDSADDPYHVLVYQGAADLRHAWSHGWLVLKPCGCWLVCGIDNTQG